ncbi:hypothetical protein Pcinc_035954 [Petrolisthes cinctipes]|uniref:Uncharacterized protein n=1 Tax=Petrolisthes cinctipes TaxID=88211 RepID=A0AAE1BYS2_PETCI|nr:hypothetical protein Pcinc_035954 [Petrolisthes cinctipes]
MDEPYKTSPPSNATGGREGLCGVAHFTLGLQSVVFPLNNLTFPTGCWTLDYKRSLAGVHGPRTLLLTFIFSTVLSPLFFHRQTFSTICPQSSVTW